MGIFGDHALRYWDAGLSVIPLRKNDKKPIPAEWSQWASRLPPKETQNEWLMAHSDGNIGLVLGSQSNVTIIDIDTTDERIQNAILSVLPASPWCRIGAKGMVLAFKFSGLKNFRLKDENKATLVEYFSSSLQVVLPPSIHPDTMKPYVANVDLLTVIDQLPTIPNNIEELLRAAMTPYVKVADKDSERLILTGFVGQGGRDIQMNRLAGLFASDVLKGNISVMKAINNMIAWGQNYVEQSRGDPLDIEKGCGQIIQYLLSDMARKDRILPPGWDDEMSEEQKKKWKLDFDEEQQEWNYDQLSTYCHKALSDQDNNTKKKEILDFTLRKLAKSQNLREYEVDEILKTLKMGTGVSLPSLRKDIKELQKGPIGGNSHSELADELVKEMERRHYELRMDNGFIHTWEGTHWIELEDAVILKIIHEEFGSLPAAKKNSDHNGILKILKTILPKELCLLHQEGINFKNGFLTSELKLIPHNKDHGLKYVMPFSYDPSRANDAKMFLKLLENAWGQDDDYQDKLTAFKEAICVTLFGRGPSFQKCVLLYGVAGSGKSQLLEIIKELVPEEARSAVPPEEWDNPFTKTAIHQKLLNIIGEMPETKRLPGKQFKELIDGSATSGQYKHQAVFTFSPIATHWMGGNFLPKTKDSSAGFIRRWLILHFAHKVPSDRIIQDLGKKIVAAEMDAVVAWALTAYKDLCERGRFTEPASHTYLLQEMGEKNCTVRLWMKARLGFDVGSKVTEKKIYNNYEVFCLQQGINQKLQQKQFISTLGEHLDEINKKRIEFDLDGQVFFDLKIKDNK